MRQHGRHTAGLIVAAAIATTMAMGPASAQMHAMVPTQVLSRDHLKAHKADLEAMLADLAKVQSATDARAYEVYLGGQIDRYVTNHKALHRVAMNGGSSPQVEGAIDPARRAVAEGSVRLSETLRPKLAGEMDRVEKLNPGLKKHFDTLRNLE